MLTKENGNLRWRLSSGRKMKDLIEEKDIVDEFGRSVKTMSESEQRFHRWHLFETSLARIWQHTVDPEISFGIISPFITDGPNKFSQEENLARVPQMVSEIKDPGYRYVVLNGYWTNEEGERVQERSILVISREDPDELLGFLDVLRKKYDQTAFTWKQAGDQTVYGIYDSGKQRYGKFRPDKIGDNYSEIMKGSHQGRPFIFESGYRKIESGSGNAIQSALFERMGIVLVRE